ncbi:hypothetical protein ACQPZK_28085 [Micromonospora sp. CA-249363]|uniref:hypothetical protein n=1 Tax=Micromonospora sp. CA-249363 TaxID=3239963 RepID=UPI003D8A712B
MARRLLAGTITPRDLTSWAYRFVTWDGTPLAAKLIALDNAYVHVDASTTGSSTRAPRPRMSTQTSSPRRGVW